MKSLQPTVPRVPPVDSGSAPTLQTAKQWLRGYYYATPVFMAVDAIFGVSLRAAALDGHPIIKWLYYGFCLLCAFFMWRGVRASGLISLGESMVNIVMIFVSFLYPYYHLVGTYEVGMEMVNPFTIQHITNFILVGGAALLSFYQTGLASLTAPTPTGQY